VSTTAYVQARREMHRVRRAAGSAFSAVDVLITPTTPTLPMTIEEADGRERAKRAVYAHFNPGPRMAEAVGVDFVRMDGLAGFETRNLGITRSCWVGLSRRRTGTPGTA
jgi:hypothetical protein